VPLLYQAATVAITRAVALTVAELSLAGLPAVLVPLPGAPGDHQTLNANALGDVGAAVMVADRDVTTERLATEVEAILLNDSKRQAMQEAAMAVGHRDAAVAVATVVLEHA
jgi:UDP-N-acetylglucosamine--N-acetylmuramyl-(pentapeptide) pyrophosphoryl-undecaprenol N-acetylglucosamine transferase